MKYYRHTITVTVLSPEADLGDATMPHGDWGEMVSDFQDSGGAFDASYTDETEELTPEQMEEALAECGKSLADFCDSEDGDDEDDDLDTDEDDLDDLADEPEEE